MPERNTKYLDALVAQPQNVSRVAAVMWDALAGQVPAAPQRPVLVGMGASFAALGAAEHVLRTAGRRAMRMTASDFDQATFDFADLIVALSQSGTSRETIEAVQAASQPTLAVVNVPGSPLTKACATTLPFGPVPDSLASTTGYTGSLVAMGMLADHWITGRPSSAWGSLGERLGEWQAGIGGLVADLVTDLTVSASADVVGSAGYHGAAEAGALLLREVGALPAAAFAVRQYMHGPMEASSGVAHLVIGAADAWIVAKFLADQGHQVTLLCTDSELSPRHQKIRSVQLPTQNPAEQYAFTAVLLQQAAAGLAAERSADPDGFLFLNSETKVGLGEPSPS